MKKNLVITSIMAAFILASCGSSTVNTTSTGSNEYSSGGESGAISTESGASGTESGNIGTGATGSGSEVAVIKVDVKPTNNPKYGNIMTDGLGLALYVYAKDTANVSNCYGGCEALWPPLLVTGGPNVDKSFKDDSNFSTITRKDGRKQVTWNGQPLYYYINDKNPGDVKGNGVDGVWKVVQINDADLNNSNGSTSSGSPNNQ